MEMSQEGMRAEMERLNKVTDGFVPESETLEMPVEQQEHMNVEAGVVPLDVQEAAPDKQEVVQDEVKEAGVVSPPKKDSENFRRLREQNRELERKMAEMESMIRSNKKVEKAEETEEDDTANYELKDDDIAEGKHFKLLNKKVKSLNEALQKERQERDKLAVEARLRSNHPDIFNVVTRDNMELLAEIEPDLVQSIISSPDTYAQHVAAYKLIKKYNIGTQDPYADDKARAQRNTAKPKSAATVSPRQGESPLAEADRFSRGMTQDLQSQLLKEMEDAISNR
jgi:hypothetical protein